MKAAIGKLAKSAAVVAASGILFCGAGEAKAGGHGGHGGGNSGWATAGKILTGVVAADLLFNHLPARSSCSTTYVSTTTYGGGYTYSSVTYGAPTPVYYAPPPPVYVAPAPVYYAPPPVYVVPQPVYVAPAPVYYAPRPVYCAPVVYRPAPVYRVNVGVSYGGHGGGHYSGHGGGRDGGHRR